MMELTAADKLVDKIVRELDRKISEVFGFSMPYQISARDLPDFEQITATDTTQIQVAAAPNVDLSRATRGTVNQSIKIGIGVCKLLTKDANGKPKTEEFRELKSLMETIFKWAWTGVDGYRARPSGVEFPAWYDFSQAVKGNFLSVVSITYDDRFEVMQP